MSVRIPSFGALSACAPAASWEQTRWFRLLMTTQKNYLGTVSALAPLAAIFCLYTVYDPLWETNDDVAMSMVAHGYGIAASAAPHLFFSNVLWGRLVQAIPEIGHVPGYSLAMLGALYFSASAMLYFLLRLRVPLVLTLTVLFLVALRPLLFPQFTITAGLLTVAAVFGLHVYVQRKTAGLLICTCLLAFLGFLIRKEEFFLVLFVALPLIPFRRLYRDTAARIACLALALSIGSASLIDHLSYQTKEWRDFHELNVVRAQFTDFRASETIKQHPALLDRYGYSINDIDLIKNWFFVDPQLMNSPALNGMLGEIGPAAVRTGSVARGFEGLRRWLRPELLPFVLTAGLLFLLAPSRKMALCLTLCALASFAMGLMGRPGLVRVYLPLAILLTLIPLPALQGNRTARSAIALVAILIAAGWSFGKLNHEARASARLIEVTRHETAMLGEETLFIWGANFPFEGAFPMLPREPYPRSLRIYALGVLTLAPFSSAEQEERQDRGFIKRFSSSAGIALISDVRRRNLLATYCRERLGGSFILMSSRRFTRFTLNRVRCEAARSP